jgi:hypothetical protein
MGFQNFQIFATNLYVLAYRFSENRQFMAKTVQNSVFLGRDPHITDGLYITVPYMCFYGFSKNSKF